MSEHVIEQTVVNMAVAAGWRGGLRDAVSRGPVIEAGEQAKPSDAQCTGGAQMKLDSRWRVERAEGCCPGNTAVSHMPDGSQHA